MTTNFDQTEALEELGRELEEVDWFPEGPDAQAFDESDGDDQKRRRLRAVLFLKANDAEIRRAVCEGNTARPELIAAGATFALTTDALTAVGGFPVPVASIANVLFAFGITKFCRLRGAKATEEMKDKSVPREDDTAPEK